jgi:hypothetical protein
VVRASPLSDFGFSQRTAFSEVPVPVDSREATRSQRA